MTEKEIEEARKLTYVCAHEVGGGEGDCFRVFGKRESANLNTSEFDEWVKSICEPGTYVVLRIVSGRSVAVETTKKIKRC